MSRIPRTPPNWPKMKVRGAVRKRLTASRIVTKHQMLVIPKANPDGSVTFYVDPLGTHWITTTSTRDGWGRSVRNDTTHRA